jgi:hypothetical protein
MSYPIAVRHFQRKKTVKRSFLRETYLMSHEETEILCDWSTSQEKVSKPLRIK